jgi:Trp operon repressor
MPYLSKKKLSENAKAELERQMFSVIAETGTRSRLAIFSELLTPTEKLVLAKRLGIILLLNKKIPFYKICTYLNVSPSTVARFENKLEKNGYRHTSKWVKRNELETKFISIIETLTSSAFGKRGKSFSKMVADL